MSPATSWPIDRSLRTGVVERRSVPIIDATPENFAPYGTILGDTTASVGNTSNHYAEVRVANPSKNFSSDEDTCVLVLCYEPRPFECKFLERHYKHTQTFIPLQGKPLVGFFAPPNDKEEPDLDEAVCFRFDGSAGFVMHKGTWHEQPFPIVPGSKAVCILRNETVRELKPTNAETRECHGQDIDKLNLEARFNVVLTTDPGPAPSAKFWRSCFLLTDVVNALVVTPRMWSTSVPKAFPVMYALGVLGDGLWHQRYEQSDLAINLGASFYFAGLFPFLVRFFRGHASRRLKTMMALLFALNLYTFGDPKMTKAPLFNEKHLANHIGSTLFFYIASQKKYQRVPMWGRLTN